MLIFLFFFLKCNQFMYLSDNLLLVCTILEIPSMLLPCLLWTLQIDQQLLNLLDFCCNFLEHVYIIKFLFATFGWKFAVLLRSALVLLVYILQCSSDFVLFLCQITNNEASYHHALCCFSRDTALGVHINTIGLIYQMVHELQLAFCFKVACSCHLSLWFCVQLISSYVADANFML